MATLQKYDVIGHFLLCQQQKTSNFYILDLQQKEFLRILFKSPWKTASYDMQLDYVTLQELSMNGFLTYLEQFPYAFCVWNKLP